MRTETPYRHLFGALVGAAALAACSDGSSGGSSVPSLSLAVTDAASDQISAFVIGLESVELVRATGAPVPVLAEPTAVDFAALAELSRVLDVTTIPADTYTGVAVTLLFDDDRVFLHDATTPAALLDSAGNVLSGTLTLPIDFPAPLVVDTGNFVLEIDLDLDQALDVDAGANEVRLEPCILPRVNRADPKEHAVGGYLRFVSLANDLFRIGLENQATTSIVTVATGPGTVYQIDGIPLVGDAGLTALDQLPVGTWVQAFGTMPAASTSFQAATVEAGTGTYNGGTDIVEGLIVGRSGGPGADAVLTVLGHSNNAAHTEFEFNLTYTVNTSFANTKVVRRGSATAYDADDLQVGQRVRMFGLLDKGVVPHVLDLTTPTDVARLEPTWVFGTATASPTGGQVKIALARVDLRDVGEFNWSEAGSTPPDPLEFVIDDPNNLATGKGIAASKPIVALGFFTPVDDAGPDFVASRLDNRERLPSLLLVRDRAAGFTVTPTFVLPPDPPSQAIQLAFSGTSTTFEKAVVDQGFVGEFNVQAGGIAVVPGNVLGVGLYTIRDPTLNTLSIYLTFAAFAQGLEDALLGGATLFNLGAIGVYDGPAGEISSALAGAVVQ